MMDSKQRQPGSPDPQTEFPDVLYEVAQGISSGKKLDVMDVKALADDLQGVAGAITVNVEELTQAISAYESAATDRTRRQSANEMADRLVSLHCLFIGFF